MKGHHYGFDFFFFFFLARFASERPPTSTQLQIRAGLLTYGGLIHG